MVAVERLRVNNHKALGLILGASTANHTPAMWVVVDTGQGSWIYIGSVALVSTAMVLSVYGASAVGK